MASRTIVACDLCGKEPAEATALVAGGRRYEVDLCAQHARALGRALSPYLRKARGVSNGSAQPVAKAGKRTATSSRKSAKKAARPARKARARAARGGAADIRAWAQANGFEVKTRGRMRPEVIAAYEAAHTGTAKKAGTAKKGAAAKKSGRKRAAKATKRTATSSRKVAKKAARPARKARPRAARGGAAAIRAWAQANGFEVKTRGRMRPEVLAAYEAAHARGSKKAAGRKRGG